MRRQWVAMLSTGSRHFGSPTYGPRMRQPRVDLCPSKLRLEAHLLRQPPGTGSPLRNTCSWIPLWSKFSCPTLLSRGVAELHKCVNPDCSAQFRYLHQGRLFEIEIQYLETADSAGQATLRHGKGYVERCWLCDQCVTHITLCFDPRRGLVVASSLGRAERVITPATPQSTANAATERTRVLIRSFDMNLRILTKRDAAGQRSVRRSEVA